MTKSEQLCATFAALATVASDNPPRWHLFVVYEGSKPRELAAGLWYRATSHHTKQGAQIEAAEYVAAGFRVHTANYPLAGTAVDIAVHVEQTLQSLNGGR